MRSARFAPVAAGAVPSIGGTPMGSAARYRIAFVILAAALAVAAR